MSSNKKDILKTSFATSKNLSKFNEFLKKNNREKCTNCGSLKYGITLDGGVPTFTNAEPDGGFIPILVKICNQCANVELLSSFIIGLIESK